MAPRKKNTDEAPEIVNEQETSVEVEPEKKLEMPVEKEETLETYKEEIVDNVPDVDRQFVEDETIAEISLGEADGDEDGSMDEMEEVFEAFAKLYEKRRTHMMSPRERKKQKIERSVTIGGRRVKTADEKIQEEAADLMAAARSVPPTLVTGEIVSFHETEHGIMLVEAKRKNGEFRIFIPVSQLFAYNPKSFEGEIGHVNLLNELKTRIGSIIKFCIYDVQEKEQIAYASRLKALDIESSLNYRKIMPDGKPRICMGMKVPAQVIGVRKDRVRVNIGGADATIKSSEMSWTSLDDLRKEFKVNDEFNVKIMSSEPVIYESLNQQYYLQKIEVSKRAAEPDPAERYFDQFFEGEYCKGIVKAEYEGGIFVRVKDKMDCLCQFPKVGRPTPGSECVVVITYKNVEKKRLYGVFAAIS